MRHPLLAVALGVALLQVGVSVSMVALSSFVGEVRGEGVLTDYRLPSYGIAIVASQIAGACLAAVALLLSGRRPGWATAGVIVGALPSIMYTYPPLVQPAVLLLLLGPLAIWVSHRSGHTHPASV
jgi:uncharacterized membrane protein